jgi:hypothetical protein
MVTFSRRSRPQFNVHEHNLSWNLRGQPGMQLYTMYIGDAV